MALHRYVDPAVYAAEVEGAFRRGWLLVGRSEQVAGPGDYLAVDVIGEPLLLVRDDAGALHCHSRLCTHRNMPLVEEGAGHAARFTCGYHLWSFRLDGSLIGAPLTGSVDGFDPGACGLVGLPVEEWLGFVFVSLDPTIGPLAERLVEVTDALAPYDVASMRSLAHRDERWPVNWKLGVENASESYHHVGTHAETVGPFAPPVGSWVEPGSPHWALHRTRIVGPPRSDADELVSLPDDEWAAFRCYTIFPSTVILVWRSSCNWLSFLPEAPDRTRLLTGMLYPAAAATEESWEDLRRSVPLRFDAINHEDRDQLTRLQAVTGSRLGVRGPLVPQEGVLAELQRYLERTVQEPA
jgi:phenylpropionate dioxygenase-like ring-hydroxylating dioxygenase large terminal subunit